MRGRGAACDAERWTCSVPQRRRCRQTRSAGGASGEDVDEGLDRHDGERAPARLPAAGRVLRGRGDEVEITARDYAQTLQLLELHGMTATLIGHHGGRSRLGKARQMTLAAAARCAAGRAGRDFDVALAHGSHELTITARRLGIPSSTTFDYEFATAAAPARLPRGDEGRRPRRDPARAARAATARGRRSSLAVPGPEGGVLPRGLRARPGRCSSAFGVDPARMLVVAAPAAGRLALPPALEPALPADARAPRPARGRARVRAAAHRGAARLRARARAAVGDRPRAAPSTRRA